jgi:hypothetical protein
MSTGKIYKITSPNTNKIYIGSTTHTIEHRLYQHQNKYKQHLQEKTHYMTSFEIIDAKNATIEMIEEVLDNNILKSRERFHIENNKHLVVNKNIPTRTKKEYEAENKERRSQINYKFRNSHKDYNSDYYQAHKEYNKTISSFYKIKI